MLLWKGLPFRYYHMESPHTHVHTYDPFHMYIPHTFMAIFHIHHTHILTNLYIHVQLMAHPKAYYNHYTHMSPMRIHTYKQHLLYAHIP